MTASIRSLYPFALAEGEGVGTAYEYFAKRRIIDPLIARTPPGGRVLVLGLPERYGTSLDFVLAAHERGARVLVADDRASALERAREAHGRCIASAASPAIEYRELASLLDVQGLGEHDLALSCEVIQRLPEADRASYVRALFAAAPRGAAFVPNGENASHVRTSGLSGLTRRQMEGLFGSRCRRSGYIDMPPFPPGITRSPAKRERAAKGRLEAAAMWGLERYALLEPIAPSALTRRVAHIVYATF